MEQNQLISFKDQLVRNLTECILPYWTEKMSDPRGGYYGRRDGYDHLDADAPKGAILNARILWTMSAAYRLTSDARWLNGAQRAYDYICAHFIDRLHGGVFWSVSASDGSPLDTRKQFYAIAFTIYGLSEYYRATADANALSEALELFDAIEAHSLDPVNGGYIEATTRDWMPIADMRLSEKDENSAKSMNTHLHIIEGYTALLRVTPDNGRLFNATKKLLEIHLDRITDPDSHHLLLFFDNEFNPSDRTISYGHDIEASWLMLETAMVIGDPALTARTLNATHHLAMAALEGLSTDGSLLYERHSSGPYDLERHWWVQAECAVGLAYLAKYHGMERGWDMAWRTWQWITDNLVDRENGEWFWSRMPDGSINRADDKAGFWKCPYHNGRMCMEIASLIND